MSESRTARRFFFGLLLVAALLVAAVIYPLASALFMAAVFAGVMWPLHGWLARTPRAANGLLIASSAFIDLFGVFLLGFALFGPTLRPGIGLLLLGYPLVSVAQNFLDRAAAPKKKDE